jgi:alkylresorcinol/alkylpyrone synthase
MRLVSLATAVPEPSWTQAECWHLLRDASAMRQLKPRSLELLEKVLLGNSGIEQRHFATQHLTDIFDRNAQSLNETFEREATALAARALRDAMHKAEAVTVDALFVCTCTGYLCPGLSSHIAEATNLAPSTYLIDNTGSGCGAALPTLRAASHYLAAHPTHRVAVVAVEICSAAFYVSDDPGVLISLCLFGDGAAAAILDASDVSGWRFSGFTTMHAPEAREKIRFVNREGRLCNQLHRSVPEVAGAAVHSLYPTGSDARLISHAAGRDVFASIRSRLPEQALAESTEVLRTRGNMSSPSVLHALEIALSASGHTPDQLWLTSFGAGFSCHGCLLQR